MSKPAVERYEQILASDPTSTVFVELAKVLIEQGELDRAVEVCRSGLQHHRDSVVGRVLWGKALISLGRPGEAMQQFDAAVDIDRDNPHAYNLIGEVLLHKGLFRSALPLLKKAVALQPNDARVRQWLEQTQRALSGGPAPIVADVTAVDAVKGGKANQAVTDPGNLRAAPPEPASEPTLVDVPAYKPSAGATADSTAPLPSLSMETDTAQTELPPGGERPGPPVADPFDAMSRSIPVGGPSEVVPGLTETFDALTASASKGTEPTIIPSADLLQEAAQAERRPRGLLDEIPSMPNDVPVPPRARAPQPAAPVPAGPSRSLLDDVPELVEAKSTAELAAASMSTQATEAIAREYEKELREKLAAKAANKSFLQRHWVKLAAALLGGVTAAAFAAFFLWTHFKNRGQDLTDALASARKAIGQDTRDSYVAALDSLDNALQMDDSSPAAWALSAYAHAIMFAEYGGKSDDKQKAIAALGRTGARDKYPGLALVTDYYLADGPAREAAAKALLEVSIDESELQEVAGRMLLKRGHAEDGVKRLTRAVELVPSNVRALVALGDYSRDVGEWENALKFYQGAAQAAPLHPERVLGSAEARLALLRDLGEALEETRKLPAADALKPETAPRRDMVLARLLAAAGQHAEAQKLLSGSLANYGKTRGFDFHLAMAEAAERAGQMEVAQRAAEGALKHSPKSEEARAAYGRILVARDRPREVLDKVRAEGEMRKVFLVRGIAYAKLGDWKRSRVELRQTQVSGRFPPDAIIWLALADANEDQADRAQEVLEKVLLATRRNKAEVRVALGQVYWQRGTLDKAKEQFTEAAKEVTDWEGNCSLGRLLLALNLPEVAVDALARAVARNGSHGEARHALIRTLLDLGKEDEALANAEAWAQDNPGSGAAQRDLALALYRAGRSKEAEAAASRAVRAEPADPEAHRVRALALFARGDARGGFQELERSNKLNSKDPATFCEIGIAFLRAGNPEDAAAAFSAVLREDAKSACGVVGGHYARLPYGAKQTVKELTDLSASAPASWQRAFALATLARVQLALGQLKEARKAAEDGVARAPHFGAAHLSLGLVAARQKDDAKAKEALSRAVELEPVWGATRLAYADALVRGDDRELARAIEEYDAFLRIGGSDRDEARVKAYLPQLKKRLNR